MGTLALMRAASPTAVPTPAGLPSHALARAFLALADDGAAAAPAARSRARLVASLVAIAVLCLAAPLAWVSPAPSKLADQPAATLGSSKAGIAEDDEDDDDG
jgi:hypothetical protein